MSDAQEYYDWKQDIDDTLCMLHQRIFQLEKKVKLLEENSARNDTNKGKVVKKK